MPARLDLPQGTLDLLILKTVALEKRHGTAIADRIAQMSEGALAVPPGSLYPALHRLERRGWLKPSWANSEHNRRAKYYELTRAGRRQLEARAGAWRQLVAAVNGIVETPESEQAAC